MGATYTRQSTITDGAVIEASHFNDEYNQILAAFVASTGHTHDGTAAEGGPITKLLGNTLTFGAATAGTDITITFDGETSDGVFKWMEDEDYFEFSDDILVASTEKLQFRDTAIYINSSADGQLDLVADTEIQIAATTVDINGNVDVSGTLTVAGAIDFGDAALSNVGALQLDSIAGDADTNTSITFSGSDVITIATGGAGRLTIGDGALSPVTNNQIDLGTSSLEFKDAFFDGTVTADAFAGPLTGNVTGNTSGSAATLATARTIGGTSFDGSANIAVGLAAEATALETARTIGGTSFDGTGNIAVALASVGTAVTVADESSDTTCFPLFATAATGDLPPKSGSNLTFNSSSGLLTATLLAGDLTGDVTGNADTATLASTITATANNTTAETVYLTFVDGATGAQGIETDTGLTWNPNTNVLTAANVAGTVTTATQNSITTATGLVSTGALNSGSITSGFGTIDNGASNITNGGLVKLDVDADADDLTGDSATGRLTIGAGEDLNLYHGGTNSYIVNDTGDLIIDTAGDIKLDAAGNDFKFLASGTEVFNITNSSSDVIIKPVVDAKDLIFQQRDGTEVMRIEDGAYASFAAAAVNPEATLTDGATVSWNGLTSPVAKVTLGGNRTLAAASGVITGQFLSILFIQDGTGSRTITFNAAYEHTGDVAPVLTTTAAKGDLFVYRYNGAKFLEVGRNLNLTLS